MSSSVLPKDLQATPLLRWEEGVSAFLLLVGPELVGAILSPHFIFPLKTFLT